MKIPVSRLFYFAILILVVYSCSYSEAEKETDSHSFTKKIERLADNEFESGLIEKTETYYPPREEVAEVAGNRLDIPDSSYWYYNSFDGTLIPYAITKEAVNYYSNLIDEFTRTYGDSFFLSADFQYQATVRYEELYQSPDTNSAGDAVIPLDFEKVYVVELVLKWDQYCGQLCAMWIDKKRIGVFDETGELLQIFLDGPISVPVS